MTCPFLREITVRYCQLAGMRKPIPIARAAGMQDKCSSGEHLSCSTFRAQFEDATPSGACPHVRESLMQYCAAAPVTRLIPYSESPTSRCGNGSFRYCELYLTMAHPDLRSEEVDGVPVPGWLRYSLNHMWLDISAAGICHAGIDAFLCRVLGQIDDIVFLRGDGRQRPTVVLRSRGVDLEMAFPNAFVTTAVNLYLRANPSRLLDEPYSGGWLFEGAPNEHVADGLLAANAARAWMQDEFRHMNECLQQITGVAADGGLFAEGVAGRLDRGHVLPLLHEFFSVERSRS